MMKAVSAVALAFALTLLSVPAAAVDTFQALRQLPAAEQEGLVPLADEQLAATEGRHIHGLILLLVAIFQEHLPPQSGLIISHTQIQANTNATSSVQRNVVEVTQQQGRTVRSLRRGM